jgi:hypothetical protein
VVNNPKEPIEKRIGWMVNTFKTDLINFCRVPGDLITGALSCKNNTH